MRVFVLTSSRADYGIYRPLLYKLQSHPDFELNIVAFGTHLSRFHGYTIENIYDDGFDVKYRVESLLLTDSRKSLSKSIGLTIQEFSSMWDKEEVDLILCLGDRFEMFAAVSSSVPFNIPVAHIHGGETTLGAIDDKFRHMLTIMSSTHFASTQAYCKKIESIIGSNKGIYHVGALGLDNLDLVQLLPKEEFHKRYGIDLSTPTILSTYHPETVAVEKNVTYISELLDAFEEINNFQIVITMPNADTLGSLIRQKILDSAQKFKHIIPVESFGTQGYFSCMKHCSFLVGNTSSGLVEAPSLGKYTINIGERQKGRARGENVIDVDINKHDILSAIEKLSTPPYDYNGCNIYYKSGASDSIINALEENYLT